MAETPSATRLDPLLDAFIQEELDRSPEEVTSLGLEQAFIAITAEDDRAGVGTQHA